MIDYTATRMTLDGVKKFYVEAHQVPFKYMVPTRPQADLAREIGMGVPQKRIFLMTSGNGAGKSCQAWNLIFNIMSGNSNIYRNIKDVETGETLSGFFDYPFFNNYPRNWPKNIWYVTNAELIKSTFEEFQNWCPEGLYIASKDGKQYISRIRFVGTKFTVFFKTIDQDPKTFEGANVGVVIFDEPPPQNLYRAALFRLRKGGIVIIPATPLFGSAWFVDEIVEKLGEGDKYHQEVSVWSNCVERAGDWDLGPFGVQHKGNLYEKDVEFMLRNVDVDEREAREFGKFKAFVGRVYKTYDREKHFVALPAVVNPQRFMYQFVLDPHDRKPPAACWIRCDQYGRKRVIREWPAVSDPQYNGQPFEKIKSSDPFRVTDFVRFFVQIFREIGVDANRLQSIIDPNFGRKPNSFTGRMIFEEYQAEFEKQGFPVSFVTDAIDDLATGHKKVKDLLAERSDGDFGILIDSACTNTDWSFRNYSYDEWEGKTQEKRTLKEGVKELGKDFVDLVRYAAMVRFEWQPHTLDRRESEGTDYEELKVDDWRKSVKERPPGAAGV